MNFLHRLFTCAALCGSVACSENGLDFESAAPEQQLRTVVIGCAGIDITTRTEIDDRLGVRWVSGDSIRLWARESGAGAPFALENIPFVFDYYSPQFKQAAFTGHRVDMSGFDSGRRYDYFAVSPTPVSVVGTSATFDIPAVQSGEFNSGCDIMTAQLTDAAALEEGDTNWSIRLPFKHHVHVLKITIPSNRLESPKFPKQEEPIRSIELTFPDLVTGRLTVDATGATEPVFTPVEGGNVLTLRFDQPKRAGDVVYAFIARQEPLSGDGKVIIKATGASGGDKPCVSVDRTFTKTREFTRGAVTTLNYNIPERYRCTKILFSLAEKAGGEAPDRAITNANGYGWGTLGEPIESFRIVDKATGEELSESAFVCDHVANRYEITCVDEGAHTAFIQRYAGRECIAKLTSASAEVEYPFTLPALEAEVENMIPALEVPYLFEEDFSGLSGNFEVETSNKNLDDLGLAGWNAESRSKGYSGVCVSLRSYSHIGGPYQSRINGCPLSAVKQGCTVTINLEFYADWKQNSAKTMSLKAGRTSGTGLGTAIECVEGAIPMENNPSASSTYIPTLRRVTVADYTCDQRIAWETDASNNGMFKYEDLFIDNIRMSIAH